MARAIEEGEEKRKRLEHEKALERERLRQRFLATEKDAYIESIMEGWKRARSTPAIEAVPEPAPLIASGSTIERAGLLLPGPGPDNDARWRDVIVPPSVVLILGKRGSGKSALGYRLLELFRYQLTRYVVGIPGNARKPLPKWIGIAPTLEELPMKAIALIDEVYLHYHARGSMAAHLPSRS